MWSYLLSSVWTQQYTNTVKKVSDIPVPSRDVTYQTLSGREKLFPPRMESVVSDIPAGYGNVDNLFLQWKSKTTYNRHPWKCAVQKDDLSCVVLKFSFGAERRAEPLSRIASLLLHSWHRGHISSPLIFILLKVVSLEKCGNRNGLPSHSPRTLCKLRSGTYAALTNRGPILWLCNYKMVSLAWLGRSTIRIFVCEKNISFHCHTCLNFQRSLESGPSITSYNACADLIHIEL